MKHGFSYFVILLLCLINCYAGTAIAAPKQELQIGIVLDGPWKHNDEMTAAFKQEILELLQGEFDVQFNEAYILTADWTYAGVAESVSKLHEDPAVDIVLALGPASSHYLCTMKHFNKPMIGVFVIDNETQGLPLSNGASGIKNLSYIASPSVFKREVEVIQQMISIKRLCFIIDEQFLPAIPGLEQRIRSIAREQGIDLFLTTGGTDADAVLEKLPSDISAILVTPLFRMPEQERLKMINGFIKRKLPSFSMYGREDVETGMLASISMLSDFTKRARRTALNLQRIVLGDDAGSIPVYFSEGQRLIINMDTARKIDFYPSWEVLAEAELLHQEDEYYDTLTLSGAVHLAMNMNPDILAAKKNVASDVYEITKAKALWLPGVTVSATGVMIDDDSAEASMGTRAERTATAGAALTQVLYSEDLAANVAIKKYAHNAVEMELHQAKLDVVLEAAEAYLNVLRIKTFERIQKDNLNLTRTNLDLAKIRQSLGISSRADVYRWENQIATSKKDVIAAQANRSLAETDMARVLNKPQEKRYRTQEASLYEVDLITSDQRLFELVKNPWTMRMFRDFMVQRGIEQSPELKQIDAGIDINRRALKAAKRSLWLPTFGLKAGVTETLSESGVGSDIESVADDTDFSVGVNASLSLFSGGANRAEIKRLQYAIEQQEAERESIQNRVEQRIRSAIFAAGSTYSGIQLSRDAAEAARKNYELIVDSYSRGTVSILELLDAQNAALVSELAAANAVYDFLIDVMRVERSVGTFDFFTTIQQRQLFFEELQTYIETINLQK